MESDEKQSVYKVYNKIAIWYSQNRDKNLKEKTCLDDMLQHVPVNGTILDVGCGTGRPILEYIISRNMNVTGVDASSAMLEIAKANFPSTDFLLQDMRSLDLNKKFDAIIAWNSFFHLPAADQRNMFRIFENHLNPNGILLFTSGTEHGEAWGINGGENLYHASLDSTEYERLLVSHNFNILKHLVNAPHCGQATIWIAKYNPYKK